MNSNSQLILANLVRSWCAKAPDHDVLTFVSIDEHGEFQEEIRTYQQLWGQRSAPCGLAAWPVEWSKAIHLRS